MAEIPQNLKLPVANACLMKALGINLADKITSTSRERNEAGG